MQKIGSLNLEFNRAPMFANPNLAKESITE
jgi:hypothetical protein